MRPLRLPLHVGMVVVWGLLAGLVCFLLPTAIAALFTVVMGSLLLYGAAHVFQATGIWFPLVVPIVGQLPMAFRQFALELCRNEPGARSGPTGFGHFVPKTVVDDLLKDLHQLRSSGKMVYGICLFTDAKRYTTLSEQLDPAALNRFMNDYLEAILQQITLHGGFVSDISGDAVFGPSGDGPTTGGTPAGRLPSRSGHCCGRGALQSNQGRHAAAHPDRTPRRTNLSGQRAAPSTQFQYRPTGDIVNTSSRIEGLNKLVDTTVLASEEVVFGLKGFLSREIGEFVLAGKTRATKVFELVGRTEESQETAKTGCSIFAQGLAAYRRRSWQEAVALFESSLNGNLSEGPVRFYIDLCQRYAQTPPAELWDGIIHLNGK